MNQTAETVTVIEPKKGWIAVDLKEVWKYRELLYFLTKRDIFFGRLAKVPSDGVPYPIFVYAGLLPWTYFANALSASGNSLFGSANLITKVYFPRIIIPASASLAGLLDLVFALLTVGYQALKAARANPAEALRYE